MAALHPAAATKVL